MANSHETTKTAMKSAFCNGQLSKALRLADDVLASCPDDWEAILMKATVLMAPGAEHCDPDKAERLMRQAVATAPSDARRWVVLAWALEACAKYVESEHALRRALRLDPNCFDALTGLPMLHDSPGVDVPLEERIGLLERAIAIAPEDWRGYAYLAYVHRSVGAYGEALRLLTEATKRVPPEDHSVRSSIAEQIEQLRNTDI